MDGIPNSGQVGKAVKWLREARLKDLEGSDIRRNGQITHRNRAKRLWKVGNGIKGREKKNKGKSEGKRRQQN